MSIYVYLIQWNFILYISPPVNCVQFSFVPFSGVFYFVFNRTYVYLVYNLIVYNTFMIADVSYRIKFDTILFTVYYIAYNTFVCDYLF